jgi:NAD(P)-dependent dehydrogenase (short-subunit alcohol dehydrogenase family)
VEQLYRRIREDGRAVSALAINAGVGVSGDFTEETSLDDELNLIRLNIIAPVHLAKRVIRDMVRTGSGKVLFTSSIAVLTVIRKRRFLDGRREGRGGLAEFEPEVLEVAFRCRMGAEFVDDRSEIGQRADRGQSRCICWANQAA